MRSGKLQQFDTPLKIYNAPANRFVAEFVGSPGMNFLNGGVDRQARAFTADTVCLPLDESQLASLDRLDGSGQVVLGIRPEHVRVSAVPHDGWLPASVYVTELMGSETFVFLTIGDKRVIARASADFRAEVGSTAWIEIETQKAHFFHPTSGERLGE